MMQQPMGLQSLLQRAYKPQQPQQGRSIPPGLQALIAAQQVLRSQAAPVTPDGRPTIAGMTEQAISQQTMPQPQGMPPQGGMTVPNPQVQPQAPGTVPQAAQAAGIAGQQQQAQQQQAMQQAMQMAQQQQGQPQGMARGGLASLPADNIARMKYAQGGVIGYASQGYVDPLGGSTEQESEPSTDVENKSAMRKLLAQLGMPAAAAIDVAQLPLNAIRKLMAEKGQDVSITPAADVLRKWAGKSQETPVASAVPDYTQDISPPATVRPAPAPAPSAPRPSVAPAAAAPAAPAAPATGLAALPGAAEAMAGMMQRAKQAVPEDPLVAQMLARQQKKELLESQRPDFEGQQAAAVQAAEEQRKALLDVLRGGDTGRRIVAFGKDLYERGAKDRLETADSLITRREQEGIAAQLAAAEAQNRLKEAAYQRKIGNEDAAMKLFQEAAKLNEARIGHQVNLAHAEAQLAGQMYSSASHLQGTRETNAMHLQVEKIRQANQLGQLDMRKQGMAVAAAKAVEADPLLKNLATMAQTGDPAAVQRYKNREAEIYLQIAPELMVGASSAPSATGARAKADAILGKQ